MVKTLGGGVQIEKVVSCSFSLLPGCNHEELFLGLYLWLTLVMEIVRQMNIWFQHFPCSSIFLSYVAIAIESIVAAICQHHAALIAVVILEIDTTLSSDFVVLFKTALTVLCPLHSCFYVIQQWSVQL